MKMKGFFPKLKDLSPKLKVSEILLCLKPQNRWKKAWSKTSLYFVQQVDQDMASPVLGKFLYGKGYRALECEVFFDSH